jgi:hypothetical protein
VTHYSHVGSYKLPMSGEYQPAWVGVLSRAGLPLNVLVIDFESYFSTANNYTMGRTASSLSTVEYIQHKEWEVMGVAITHMRGDAPFADYDQATQWHAQDDGVQKALRYYQNLYGERLEKCVVVMQNANFDASVLALRYKLWPAHVIDLLGLSRAWNSRQHNDLEHLCVQYGLPAKGETSSFDGLSHRIRYTRSKPGAKRRKPPIMRPVITEEQASALATYAMNDAMREWELFTIMLPRLSNATFELQVMQHTLELFTRPRLGVDLNRAKEITLAMTALVNQTFLTLGVPKEQISGDKSFDLLMNEALAEAGDEPAKYYKFGKREALLAIAKDDPQRALLERHASGRVRDLMAARNALTSWPNHIQRVERICRMAIACNGVLPVPLKYCGAHTGRFSGGEKINLQNLGSRGHELVSAVREILIAISDDYRLVIVDLSAIEARVLAWIARQADLVAKFTSGEEIYCGFAAKVLGVPVRKPLKSGGIPAVEARHKWARNSVGKIGILGCGYGMGAFEPGSEKTKPNYFFSDAGLDVTMAEKIVTTYREVHPQIVEFWRATEKAFIYAVKYKTSVELPLGLRFEWRVDCDCTIILPNGREIHYPKVRMEEGRYSDKISTYNEQEHKWDYLWGGTITENIVQAIARDILIEAGMRLEQQGLEVVHHVHDELILMVKTDAAPAALKAAIREMSTTPGWAPGLPLAAEGLVSKAYGGH